MRPISTDRSGRASICSQQPGALVRLEVARARRSRAARARARTPAARRRAPRVGSRSRTSSSTSATPAAVATIAAASGPHTTSGRRVSVRQRARDLLDRFLATARCGPAPSAAARRIADRRARLQQTLPGSEQERGQPVGDLHRPVGERHRRVRREQPDRADGRQPGVGREAREHVAAVDAVAAQQARDEPRARQPSGHVVLEVGVQPPVARMQLGRGAHREHGGVERVQPEPLGGGREQRVGLLRAEVAGQRQRLIVGDVEPAERVVGVSVLRRDRAAPPRAAARRGTRTSCSVGSAGDVTGRCLGLALHRVARLGHRQRPAERRAPLLHDMRQPRARSARRRPGCPGCTRRPRRRCRCRP